MSPRARHFIRFLVVAAVFLFVAKTCFGSRVVDVVTFNIENYPKSERQVDGAFEALEAIEPEIVALQEIRKPEEFRFELRSRLGSRWHTAWPNPSPRHHVGLAYDSGLFEFLSSETHRTTEVCPGAACKPTLEVRLRRKGGAEETLAVFVVHLKAYDDGIDERREQYRALQDILQAARDRGDRIVLAGDFNSTRAEDRELIAKLAATYQLRWPTRRLDCTGYWKPENRCLGTALDHILVDGASPPGAGRGPCRSVGCDPGESCPVFFHQVSDHCPVTVALPP